MAHINHIHKYIQDLWGELRTGGGATAQTVEVNSFDEEWHTGDREEFRREKTPENIDDVLFPDGDDGNGTTHVDENRTKTAVDHLLSIHLHHELLASRDVYTSEIGGPWSKTPVHLECKLEEVPEVIEFGLNFDVEEEITPLVCWETIFSDELIEKIVDYLNVTIAAVQDTSQCQIDLTNKFEVRGLFALIYFTGIFHFSRRKIDEFWETDGTGVEIFRQVMSYRRFEFLMNCLERVQQESFEEILNLYNENCQIAYNPSECLTIHEKTEGNARAINLVDSKSFFTYNIQIELLDEDHGPFQTKESTSETVLNLVKPIAGSKRNVTMSSQYSDVELFRKLWRECDLTAVGTVKHDSEAVPIEFLAKRDPMSSRFGFQPDITLISFVTKTNTNFLLLSTLHHHAKLTEDVLRTGEPQKPEAIEFYSVIRHCVTLAHKLFDMSAISKRLQRWNLGVFYHLLNVAGVNSQILYRSAVDDEDLRRTKFLKKLALDMINSKVPKDRSKPSAKQFELKDKFKTLGFKIELRTKETMRGDDPLDRDSAKNPARRKPTRKRCKLCNWREQRKTSNDCEICRRAICSDHTTQFCIRCTKGMLYK